jgi:hypothetical protein
MNRNRYPSLSPEHRALLARAICDIRDAAPYQARGKRLGIKIREWNAAIRATAIRAVLIAYNFTDQEPEK